MNINPKSGKFSEQANALGLNDFKSLSSWIQKLPYGRNKSRDDFGLVFTELKGTCSSKHALVKAIAEENEWNNLELCLAIFWMNGDNTPKAKPILANYKLAELPEAHTYLRVNGAYVDLTGIQSRISEADLEDEIPIEAEGVISLKEAMHKGYIAMWCEECEPEYSSEEIWKIREACIAAL